MTTTPENTAGSNQKPAVPRAKLWIFFGLFFLVAVGMYAGTMYRIQHDGFTGTGQDQLAHPKGEKAPTGAVKN